VTDGALSFEGLLAFLKDKDLEVGILGQIISGEQTSGAAADDDDVKLLFYGIGTHSISPKGFL
jgi:hypothetical protein